jgi:hypothetical protein
VESRECIFHLEPGRFVLLLIETRESIACTIELSSEPS